MLSEHMAHLVVSFIFFIFESCLILPVQAYLAFMCHFLVWHSPNQTYSTPRVSHISQVSLSISPHKFYKKKKCWIQYNYSGRAMFTFALHSKLKEVDLLESHSDQAPFNIPMFQRQTLV